MSMETEIAGMNARIERVYADIAQIPQIKRGQVWCRRCGRTQRVDGAAAVRSGWPTCCGHTMTIDSPEEQRALAAKKPTT